MILIFSNTPFNQLKNKKGLYHVSFYRWFKKDGAITKIVTQTFLSKARA